MSRTIIAAEIGYRDTTVSPGETSYLYAASETFVTLNTDTLANTYFAGRLDGEVRYGLHIKAAFWGGRSSVGVGAVEVINDDGTFDSWINKEFRDQPIVLKTHTSGGTSYDSATVLLNAIIERMDVVSESILRFVIRDPAAPLVVPMSTSVYDDTTDAEGVLKPIAFGQPRLVRPVLVDEATLEYAVTDAVSGMTVQTVYDQGVSIDFNQTASGFKLTTDPTGKVTATILTSGTGNDPILTDAPTLYTLSGESRSIKMFDGGSAYDMSTANHSRASSAGGKFYFELYVADMRTLTGDRAIQSFGDASGSLAVGITSAAVVSTQDPKDSGFYCMAAGFSRTGAVTSTHWNAYGNDALLDSFSHGSALLEAVTIGVKVDFDSSPMTISFLRNDANPETGSSPATTAFGPHGIPVGTYSPVCGDVKEPLAGDTIVTIRLIEDDFVYSIPANHTAWSEGITADSSFDKLTESITDRLTGVTFDSTSVATISALAHSSPAVEYTYGYYLDKHWNASQVLTAAVSGIGGYWFMNRLGNVQVGQLTAAGTSVATIDDSQITGDISIAPDYATALSNGAGALRNWSPYRASEVAGSATEVWKQQISREYQSEYRSTNTLASGYTHATGAPIP